MKVVYILYSNVHQAIKVGYASDIGSRISTIQISTPEKLSLMFTFEGGKELEEYFHERLKPFHIRGEWFEYNNFVKDFLVKYLEHQLEFFTFKADEKLKDDLYVFKNDVETSILEIVKSYKKNFTVADIRKKLPFINFKSKDIEKFLLLNGWQIKQYGSCRTKFFYKEV
jgi:hypothetical protein